MARTPERLGEEVGVSERPVEIPIPKEVESKDAPGVKATPSTFKAQVQDDRGEDMIQTPDTKKISITLPKTVDELESGSKGKIVNALTGFSKYWLRRIKKANILNWDIFQSKK